MTGRSWRLGCPVGLDDLRLLTVSYWGFDGQPHAGNLVVHRDHAAALLAAFHSLFDQHFPIERIQLVDDFGADDAASMAANNTSAFNCRAIDGHPGVWSEHSYGWAVDINPVQNPWVRGIQVDPPGRRPLRRPLRAGARHDPRRGRRRAGLLGRRLDVGRHLPLGQGLPALLGHRPLTDGVGAQSGAVTLPASFGGRQATSRLPSSRMTASPSTY